MSKLAATQIPKPADEQAFERASAVLWRCLLGDPSVQRNGRRGQRQNGVDLSGWRDGNPDRLVGIQCKLKGDGQFLGEAEVREELRKALTFKPALQEYFITTTAPDDVAMQELARELTLELRKQGRMLLVYIWGWNTLEEHISEHQEALRAFDPSYGVFGAELLHRTEELKALQATISTEVSGGFSSVTAYLQRIETSLAVSPGDATITAKDFESHLDAEIDNLRDLVTDGKPRTALPLLEKLLERIGTTASGRILFRVKANIANCHIAMGDQAKGTSLLLEAYEHAPDEPKAAANKGYALLLRGDWRKLTDFATEALKADPTNEVLAGYLVQAARFDTTVTDPLRLVPEALRTSLAVTIAHVFFLRHRSSDPTWREAARNARESYPDDEHAQQFAADADLDEIVQDPEFQRTHLLSPAQKERLIAATKVLTRLWDETRQTEGEVPPDALGPCANLIVAYTAIGDLPKALEIARQGLAVAPDDHAVLLRAAVAAVEAKDDDFAAELLKKLPPSPDITLLSFRFHAHRGDWEELARYVDLQPSDVAESEYVVVRTTARLAKLRLSEDDRREKLAEMVDEVRDNPRASVVVSGYAQLRGFDELAEMAFENAVSRVNESTHIADRLMTAMQAVSRKDWLRVADLLDGYIAEDVDSEVLRALATAYVNIMPVRKQAVRFFGRLPAVVAELPFYIHCAGLFHFNRGAPKQAEAWLRRAVDACPNVENCLALCATLRRNDRKNEVPTLLGMIKVEELKGAPGQKMFLAQVMREAGYDEQAMAYAYDVLRQAPNDPEAALRYFGLVMFNSSERLIPDVKEAGPGVWVRLEDESGKKFAFLIEEGKDRPAEGVLSPRHPTAAKAMGLRVGDTFVQPSSVGEDVTWRVAELKHKYLHALHDMMENFETRFPDSQGFYSMTMRDGDIGKALDQVRKVAETNQTMADLYLEKRIPMVMVAALIGGDTTGFADYVRSLGETVVVCSGTHPERAAAISSLDKRRAAGAVLDTHAAWTAATMDAFDVLISVFGKLVVPQSTLDELRTKKEGEELLRAGSMTVGWHDGEFIKQEHTQDSIDARVRYVGEQIDKIEEHCSVLPVEVPDEPSELANLLLSRFDTHVLDAAYLAADGYVLLSEDLHYRQIAEAAADAAPGVWFQAVLAYARDRRMVTLERYADLIVQLAWRRHRHLFLDNMTLGRIFLDDKTGVLSRFKAAADFIGTKDADIASHLSVLEEFLTELWGDKSVDETRKRAATGILLERIVRHQPAQWHLILAYIRFDAQADLQEYMRGWIRGHFLSEEEVATEERRLVAHKAAVTARLFNRRRRRIALTSSWPRGL